MTDRKRKQYDDDDNRTVCKMNVPGMPWYSDDVDKINPGSGSSSCGGSELNKNETWWIIWGTMRAGFLIAAVFSVMLFVVIGICLLVWC